jgi:polyphosphate glucokinase
MTRSTKSEHAMKIAAIKAAKAQPQTTLPRTLAVDIGGTGIKTIVLDQQGRPISDRLHLPTPSNATPRRVIRVIGKLASAHGDFERVSIGFPGVIKDGVVFTAANLGKGWTDFNLAQALTKSLGHPVRVTNDADIQGLGSVSGQGLELVITLGTGFGSVLFADGRLIHLEVGHHPFRKGRTYEDDLGKRALAAKGQKRWNKRLRDALGDLKRTFNYDRLYIGGGNTRFINIKLPPEVTIVSNESGLLGGIKLWEDSASTPPQPNRSAPAAPDALVSASEPAPVE